MLKLNINALRWLLLVVNVLGLGLFGYVGFLFLSGDRNESDAEKNDPVAYAIKDEVGRASSKELNSVVKTVNAVKPKEIKKPKTPVQLPVGTVAKGGALKDWNIINITLMPKCRMAHVIEGSAKELGASRAAPRKSTGRKGSRARRKGPKSAPRIKSMVQGEKFRYDDPKVDNALYVFVEYVGLDEEGGVIVYYKDLGGTKKYSLTKESTPYDADTILVGTESIDEDKKSRVQIDPSEMGSIGKGMEKKKIKKINTTKKDKAALRKEKKKADEKAKN